MIDRYMLFAWNDYYPDGGMEDFIDYFITVEAAQDKAREISTEKGWEQSYEARSNFQIYDTIDRKVVWEQIRFKK